MSFLKTLVGAKVGVLLGSLVLGPVLGPLAPIVGGKLGALIGSGGNPLALLGLGDAGNLLVGPELGLTIYGGPDTLNGHGNTPADIQGNPQDRLGNGNLSADIWGRNYQ